MSNLLVALEHAAADVNRIAYSFEGIEGTYQDLNQFSNQLANKLKHAGYQKGDHFALIMGNRVEFIGILYGIWKMGGVVIPINPTYTKHEMTYILENANVKCMFSVQPLEDVVYAISQDLTDLKHVYIVNSEFQNDLNEYSREFDLEHEFDAEHIALILYTSGTTGKPKGAMLSHQNLYSNALETSKALEINENDVVLVALPMYHIFAMTVCVNMPIVTQSKMVIMTHFSPKQFFECIKKEKVTFFGGVPTMYNFIYHYLKDNPKAFSTITHCASGGASLQVALIDAYKKEFGITIQEGYGLSEGAGVVTLNPRRGMIKAGTVGYAIGRYETKIVDELGQEVSKGVVGELICKGENIFSGYYQMPEQTKATLRDGWLYTGDLAVEDEEGYISIVDRKKDLIIVGGYNVYPREVEEVLYAHEKIIEAGVIGETDETYGQKVVAFLVGKEGLTEEEVLTYCKENLAPYKIPKTIYFMNELPKTSSGKVMRKNLSSKGGIR